MRYVGIVIVFIAVAVLLVVSVFNAYPQVFIPNVVVVGVVTTGQGTYAVGITFTNEAGHSISVSALPPAPTGNKGNYYVELPNGQAYSVTISYASASGDAGSCIASEFSLHSQSNSIVYNTGC